MINKNIYWPNYDPRKVYYVKIGDCFNYKLNKFEDVRVPIRSWGNMIIEGQPRYGKCQTKDMRVMTDKGLLRMDELESKGASKILSLNKKVLKPKFSNIQKVFKREYNDEIIKIHSKMNHSISLTPNHMVFVWDNGLKEKPASEIIVGDIMVSFRKYTPEKQNYNTSADATILSAYLISEGCLDGHKISFTNNDPELLQEYKSIIESNDWWYKTHHKSNATDYTIYKNVFKDEVLKFTGLTNGLSPEKYIPEWIFNSSPINRKLFLNRLFSGDGHINKNLQVIEYTTISKTLAQDVIYLLSSIGITAKISESIKYASNTINKRKVLAYRVWISGNDIIKFFHEVGFYGAKRLEMYNINVTCKNNLTELIYNIDNELLNIRADICGGKRNIHRDYITRWLRRGRSINRFALLNMLNVHQLEYDNLRSIIDSDLIFLPVNSISSFEYNDYVYDVAVEDDECYFAGEYLPFLVHNSSLSKDFVVKISKFRKVVIFDYGGEWQHSVLKYNRSAEFPDRLVNVKILNNFTFNIMSFNNREDYASMGFDGWQASIVCDVINETKIIHQGNIEKITEIIAALPVKQGQYVGFNNKYGTSLVGPINSSQKTSITTRWGVIRNYFWKGENDNRAIFDFKKELLDDKHLIIDLSGEDNSFDVWMKRAYAGKILELIDSVIVDAKPFIVFEESRMLFPSWNSGDGIMLSSNVWIKNVVTHWPKRGVAVLLIMQHENQIFDAVLENVHERIVGRVQEPTDWIKRILKDTRLEYNPERNIREFFYFSVQSDPSNPTWVKFRPVEPCCFYHSDR